MLAAGRSRFAIMPKLKALSRLTARIDDQLVVVYAKPMGKPRQSQSDKWNQRPVIVRMRKLADDLREAFGLKPMEKFHSSLTFQVIATFKTDDPLSLELKRHLKRPDADNILKLYMDSLLDKDDWCQFVSCQKLWGTEDILEIRMTGVDKYV
jgi:hypothetical protein